MVSRVEVSFGNIHIKGAPAQLLKESAGVRTLVTLSYENCESLNSLSLLLLFFKKYILGIFCTRTGPRPEKTTATEDAKQ